MHPALQSMAFLAVTTFLSTAIAVSHAQDRAAAPMPLEPPDEKPRLIVLTDIGGDPDDQQSMIRLMLYANEFDIEGLVASASGTPGELKEKTTKPDLIRQIIRAYSEVRDNLALHASGYPDAAELIACVNSGNANRGESAVGEGRDTEGSRWIISVVDRDDARPVNVAIWGGQTDLAQALWRVRRDRGASGLQEFIAKIRVHDIADQDGIAEYLGREFPGLFYVLNKAPTGRDKRDAVFRGMYLGGDMSLTSQSWIDTHVRQGHGPLGALYPAKTWTAPNPHAAMKEGDTPSWFYFRAAGLSDPQHPEWGGWGGRFERHGSQAYRDATDEVDGATSARATVWRWRQAFQNDLQARMDWCVKSPDKSNHAPTAVCNGTRGERIIRLTATPGQHLALDAAGSSDVDGDELTYRWWVYQEPSTCPNEVLIRDADAARATVHVPEQTGGGTLHVILEVVDTGSPPLTDYRRVIIEIPRTVAADSRSATDASPYPPSPVIAGIELGWSTHLRSAPGSDNFQLTWADDGHQYGAWGDGGGFGGTNGRGRVGLGVARVEGTADDYRGFNVWGGENAANPATFDGKSWGMISVRGSLFMWVVPDKPAGKPYRNHYEYIQLARSTDHGANWTRADWNFHQAEDLSIPTFLNFGRDNAGVPDAWDRYVYSYFIRPQNRAMEQEGPKGVGLIVHQPGLVYLARVPISDMLDDKEAYEFFRGLSADGRPQWGPASDKQPVFSDPAGVGWCMSASYIDSLGRVLLCTEHGISKRGMLGIFDAPAPWGPWTTVEYYGREKPLGAQREGSQLAWNHNVFFAAFPTKWIDGSRFILTFTGAGSGKDNDSFNTVQGRFVLP